MTEKYFYIAPKRLAIQWNPNTLTAEQIERSKFATDVLLYDSLEEIQEAIISLTEVLEVEIKQLSQRIYLLKDQEEAETIIIYAVQVD